MLKDVSGWMNENAILYVEVPDLWNFVDWNDTLSRSKSNFDRKNLRWLLEALVEVLEVFNVQDKRLAEKRLVLSKWTEHTQTSHFLSAVKMRMLGQSSNCTILIRKQKLKDNKSVYECKVRLSITFTYHKARYGNL